MTRDELAASLRQIQSLANECLAGLQQLGTMHAKSGAVARTNRPTSRLALPKRLLELRDAGFFSVPRTAREVQESLSSSYRCEVNRVAMALLRLKKKELRKASKVVDGKKQVAYVW